MEISRYKPDSCIKNIPHTTVAGILQELPVDAIRLIDVVCNVGGNAVIQTDRKGLSLQNPGWTREAASAQAKAFMYHDADPTRFYVYPPSAGGGSLRVVYSSKPAATTLLGNISIADEYRSSLIHYICFKAFTEDSMSPDTNKAAGFHGLFMNSLQMSEAGDKSVEPRGVYANSDNCDIVIADTGGFFSPNVIKRQLIETARDFCRFSMALNKDVAAVVDATSIDASKTMPHLW